MPQYFREWREIKGLSVQRVARTLGVAEHVVSRIETGERDYTGAYLAAFSALINCPWGAPITYPPNRRSSYLPSELNRQDGIVRYIGEYKRICAREDGIGRLHVDGIQ